jgi:hypothetical protein
LNYLGVEITGVCIFVDSGSYDEVGNQFVSLSEVANFVVAVFEGDCGRVGAGTSTSGCFEQVGVIVTIFIPNVVVIGGEQIAILIVGIGKCLVTIDPLFGFNPVEGVVSVFDEPSVTVDAAGEVVELVVCR